MPEGHADDDGEQIAFTVGELLDALADVSRERPVAASIRPRGQPGSLGDLRAVYVDVTQPKIVVLEPLDGESSALVAAIDSGDVQRVRDVIDDGADVNERDRRGVLLDGAAPLTIAADAGHLAIAELLVERGADVNARSLTGWTALMRACNAGHLDMARFLLQAGADPSLENDEGYTARGRISGTQPELLHLLEQAEAAQ